MVKLTHDWTVMAVTTIWTIYLEDLGRVPDYDGLAGYLWQAMNGATAEDIRASVRASTEYAERQERLRTPPHKTHPEADACYPLRTDICGVRVPSTAPENPSHTAVVFSPIYPCYSDPVRADIRRAFHDRGFTSMVIDPRPKYHGVYPGKNLTVDEYRATCTELVDDGFALFHFLIPDDQATDEATWDWLLGPILADPEIRARMKRACVAWEMNGWMDPPMMERAIRWCRARIPADCHLYVHFTPNHAAGSGPPETEQHWYFRLAQENLLDGIALQLEPRASLEEQVARVEDFLVRLCGGLNQWPTHRADGRPMRVLVFEYDAFLQVNGQSTEELGRARRTVFEHLPNISGVLDQP